MCFLIYLIIYEYFLSLVLNFNFPLVRLQNASKKSKCFVESLCEKK